MDERVLAERLITYDTSTGDGLRAAVGFVKGWLEARDIPVTGREFGGLPVVLADVGPADGPCVIFHGHVDVVPAHADQFTPRVVGDRLIGRGAYDMKGALAAMMCAVRDVADNGGVRVRFVCVPDEESENPEHRCTDALVEEGLRADFAITGEPTDLHIGVQAKGVLAVRVEVSGIAAMAPRRGPATMRSSRPTRCSVASRPYASAVSRRTSSTALRSTSPGSSVATPSTRCPTAARWT